MEAGRAAAPGARGVSIIKANGRQSGLFLESKRVLSRRGTAGQFWTILAGRFSVYALRDLVYAFFSDEPGVEDLILRCVLLLLRRNNPARDVFSDRRLLTLGKLGGRVAREVRRFQGTARFRRLRDGLYYGTVEPGYNILPLLAPYFATRFAGRQWLLHDVKRNTGLFCDGACCRFLSRVELRQPYGEESAVVFGGGETAFHDLWQVYLPGVTGTENSYLREIGRPLTFRHRRYHARARRKELSAFPAGKNP